MYTFGIIKEEKAFKTYCMKRWGELPRFVESFAHMLTKSDGMVNIERFFYKAPNDDRYYEYFILSMQHARGAYYNEYVMTQEAKQQIMKGTAKIIKVQ